MSNGENGTSKFQMVCVVAMANNRVIGDGDSLIWHLPGDLARVKSITMGCPLIMGRRTWHSIGRPLPGRLSIVLTRDTQWHADGCIAVNSLSQAIAEGKKWLAQTKTEENRLILFGGGEIYNLGIDLCQWIELTTVNISPNGGTLFPEINWQEWQRVSSQTHAAGATHPEFGYHRYHYSGGTRYL